MLKTLQKDIQNTLSIFTNKDSPQMAQENLEVVEKLSADLATAQTELASKDSAVAALTEQLATLSGKFAELEAQLALADAAKQELIQKAQEAKLEARKERIVASIGTAKADALMAATQGLDDAAFDSVVGALAGSVEDESKTALFVEQGVTAEATVVQTAVAGAAEKALIKQKFNVTQ